MESIVNKTEEAVDIRIGLFLLRESAFMAETSSSKQIKEEHVKKAISKISDFKKPIELDKDEEEIMGIVNKNPNKTTAEIFSIYQSTNQENKSQRTFLRKINNLEKANLIRLEEVQGIQGRSYKVKKLSEF